MLVIKKMVLVFLSLALTLSFAACSNNSASSASSQPAPSVPVQSDATSQHTQTWVPTKEVTIINPSSAGGGTDKNLRMVSEIAFSNNFTPKNWLIDYPGDNAMPLAMQNAGNDHMIYGLHNGNILSLMLKQSPFLISDLTYLPIVAFDDLVICVTKESPYKTIEELLEAAKTEGTIRYAGSQLGTTDGLSYAMVNKEYGTKLAYVEHKSSGEAMTTLLGNHVDCGIFNPSECIGQVQSGDIIPIVTFAAQRISGDFSEVPTFAELGHEALTIQETRGFAGVPDMSPEAVAFYDDVIKKVCDTEKWMTDYIETNYLTPMYMTSAEATAYWDKLTETYIAMGKEIGLIE